MKPSSTSKPEKWSKTLAVLKPDDSLWFETDNFSVTNSLEAAVAGADQIWLVQPSFMFPDTAKKLLPLVQAGQMIMCVPGAGGAEFSFAPHIEKGCVLCGLQRVHSIARLHVYGKAVYMLGRKPNLQLAAIPSDKTQHYADVVGDMLDLPCEALPNYLVVTLTPSNPILHTTRIYSMFGGWKKGDTFDHNILFYEEWTDEASKLLIDCDAELQEICRRIDKLDLRMVKSLKLHYESDTGKLVGADVTNIEKIWNWYLAVCNEADNKIFSLPVSCPEDFYKIYLG